MSLASGTLSPMTFALAAEKIEIPALIGTVLVAGILLLAFAVATGKVGKGLIPEDGEQPEELQPVVAGIAHGSAGVPRWLYLTYVIIPAWALFYLVTNNQVRGETVPSAQPSASAPAEPSPGASASPAGTVKIEAKNIQFTKKEIALKAGTRAEIAFTNADKGIPHNIAVFADEAAASGGTALFRGEVFPGVKTMTYTFDPPPAGSYYFHCDIHPTMNGTVTVS